MSVAKRKEQDSDMIERFELFIGGQEIGHGFTDSVDSDDVENRMEKLGWRDSALIAQLRNHKLPESGGFGIGIERLVQVSMGVKNIKDVVVPQIL
jgi:lysyl-tRNA synthetase class 2